MTRRELIVGGPRLWLLAWRFNRKTALPAFAMSALRILDRWSAERTIDRVLEQRGRDR
jgi:hypothetical protein